MAPVELGAGGVITLVLVDEVVRGHRVVPTDTTEVIMEVAGQSVTELGHE